MKSKNMENDPLNVPSFKRNKIDNWKYKGKFPCIKIYTFLISFTLITIDMHKNIFSIVIIKYI